MVMLLLEPPLLNKNVAENVCFIFVCIFLHLIFFFKRAFYNVTDFEYLTVNFLYFLLSPNAHLTLIFKNTKNLITQLNAKTFKILT